MTHHAAPTASGPSRDFVDTWEAVGEPVAFRGGRAIEGGIQAYVLHSEHSWALLELRLGERVLMRMRHADYLAHHVVPFRGRDALLITAIQGPPGTCIWSKSARLYTIEADEVTLRHDIPLGDYLDCVDEPYLACGCGAWEADWRIEHNQGGIYLATTPTFRSPESLDAARAARVPSPRRLRLQ